MTKSRRMRCMGHVLYTAEMRTACRMWLGNLKGRDHSEDVLIYWGNNIKMKLKKLGWKIVGWIHVALHIDPWWAIMYVKMNLWDP
jgi:hypothetical protein